jgi:two-component system, cell cycle sensor histidine kinase and response regulator CckA
VKYLVEHSPIGIYRATEGGALRYANPALARLLGYSVEELLAKNLNADIYLDPEERTQMLERCRAAGGVVDGDRVRWRRKDGRPLTVRLYGRMVEDGGDGRGATFDASVIDVTEAEAQSERVTRAVDILDLVVHQMPAIYWRVDRALRVVETGGAIQQILGLAPDRYLGMTLGEVHRIDPGKVDPVERHRAALAGETVAYETEYRGRHLSNTLTPYFADGEIRGVIGTCIDVTAARAIERRMVDAQRAESLGVLAGGLAHDFNNLLVAILGNADLGLRETAANAPGRGALENIRHAALRAAELTDQLLAYAGRGIATATRVSPRTVVDELLRITAPTFPATVRTEVDIPEELGIRGDAGQIRQVVLNLINNARDALAGHGGGTIRITAELRTESDGVDADDVIPAPPGSHVVLSIADDGPGIDRDTRRRIFEPFFTTKSTGHGLGLAAVLGIVRSHGGGLRLTARLGGGARFEVRWPADMAVTAPARGPRTVLIIDDEDLVRDVVARMVEDLGYAALTAADGRAGLALALARDVDAVLVDLTMPLMSGADVIGELRTVRPGLPIVLCTGFDRDRRGPVQADAYLPKPFRMDALEQTLARLIG